MSSAIAIERLRNQHITRKSARQPAGVVEWFGAMQAQEYAHAKWGIALRIRRALTNAHLDRGFDNGDILRTHVMRPTWHFVAPADIRWLAELSAPQLHRVTAPYNRRLELDTGTLVKGASVIERALSGGRYLTRVEIAQQLATRGIVASGSRLAHLVMYAEAEGIVCSGPRREHRFTYALTAERAPNARRLERDEALAELARRYFRSHGPATLRDFMWWSGLKSKDAKRGLEMNRPRPMVIDRHTYWTIDGPRSTAMGSSSVHLLPVYDEYIVAYRDRAAVPHVGPGPGGRLGAPVFQHALLVNGQIGGTWRTERGRAGMSVDVYPSARMSDSVRRELQTALERYRRFLGASMRSRTVMTLMKAFKRGRMKFD